jgi:hypothetical protein
MRIPGIIALGAIAFAVAACGGGGGSTPGSGAAIVPGSLATPGPGAAATATPAGALPAGSAIASVSVKLPKGTYAAATRRAQTIGANTESITFTLLQVNGVAASRTPQSCGLTASSPGCATNAGTGNLVCTLSVGAPVGTNDVFLAQTFSGPNGTGTLTGSGAVAFSVAQNAVNSASISLNAQVASIYLVSSSPYLGPNPYSTAQPASVRRAIPSGFRAPQTAVTGGTANTLRVFVIALDSAGNIILNPSSYDTPITLQLAFQYGNPDVTLSATYAPGDPSPCTGGTAGASGFYGYLPICSPSDTVTATLVSGVSGGAQYGIIIGTIGATPAFPTPASNTTPPPLPSTPPAGAVYTSFLVTSTSGTVALTDSTGTPVTSLEPGNVAYTYVTESGFSGSFTATATSCSGIANVYMSYNGYGYVPGVGYTSYGALSSSGIAAGSCSATVSDGTASVTVPVTVTAATVTGS